MLLHVLDSLCWLDKKPVIVVRAEAYKDSLGNEYKGGNKQAIAEVLSGARYNAEFVEQDYLKGDGFAVWGGLEQSSLRDFEGEVLIMWGDVPNIHPLKILALITLHFVQRASMSIGSTFREKPYSLVIEVYRRSVLDSLVLQQNNFWKKEQDRVFASHRIILCLWMPRFRTYIRFSILPL